MFPRLKTAALSQRMSKKASSTNTSTEFVGAEPSDFLWSKSARMIASAVLVSYLAIVLLGPFSNPIASPHLSGPLSQAVAPIHQALFLDHGYRFFGPDPGPSHRLLYQGVRADGTEYAGHFPDRESNWPRLLYHRWFMLSETMFNEQVFKPSTAQFQELGKEYDRQIEKLRKQGKSELLEQLKRERELDTTFFESSSRRVELLVRAVAEEIMTRNDGESIELFIQERKIPYPEEVSDGLALDDPSLLNPPVKICELDETGFRSAPKIEDLPSQEAVQ